MNVTEYWPNLRHGLRLEFNNLDRNRVARSIHLNINIIHARCTWLVSGWPPHAVRPVIASPN